MHQFLLHLYSFAFRFYFYFFLYFSLNVDAIVQCCIVFYGSIGIFANCHQLMVSWMDLKTESENKLIVMFIHVGGQQQQRAAAAVFSCYDVCLTCLILSWSCSKSCRPTITIIIIFCMYHAKSAIVQKSHHANFN